MKTHPGGAVRGDTAAPGKTPLIDAPAEDVLAVVASDRPEPDVSRYYVAGPGAEVRAVAEGLVEEMRRNRSMINSRGTFADAAESEQVLSLYDDAIIKLTSRIER